MAKSILEIDVEDESFRRFMELFEKYQSSVKELPGEWNNVAAATSDSSKSFADMTAAMMAQSRLLHEQAMQQKELHHNEEMAERRKTEANRKQKQEEKEAALAQEKNDRAQQKALDDRKKAHEKIRKEAVDTAKAVGKATLDLLKWINIGGLLAGAGSAWGLGTLAGNISDAYRTSQGLDVSTGSMQALAATFGKYFDTRSVLSGISSARADYNKQWIFNALGLDQNKEPGELTIEAAQAAKRVWAQSGGKVNDARVQAAMGLGFTLEDFRRLQRSEPQELLAARRDYGEKSQKLTLSAEAQKAWQDFHYRLDYAGVQIQNILGSGLQKLAPALTDLTESVIDNFAAFVNNGELKHWIEDLAKGIKDFSAYISTPQFRKDVQEFVTDFGLIVKAIADGLRALGVIPQETPGPNARRVDSVNDQGYGDFWSRAKNVQVDDREPTGKYRARARGLMHDLVYAGGWTKNQAAGIAANIETESRYNPFAVGDKGKAYGIAQWHPDRQKEYEKLFGHTMQSVTNFDQAWHEQIYFLNYELRKGKEKAAGEALAKTHSARGAAEVISRKYERPANADTQAKQRGNRAEIIVNINNATGGNAVASASQLPQ